jgi:transposase InsO family protein
MPLTQLNKLSTQPGTVWGTLALPSPFVGLPPDESREQRIEAAWILIAPLVRLFDQEKMLDRHKFTAKINERADAMGAKRLTVWRLIQRYYYFGRNRNALLPLPAGPIRGSKSETEVRSQATTGGAKRRGPHPILAKSLGPIKFVVASEDIQDMVKRLRRSLRKSVTYLTDAHEAYLEKDFRRRHPDVYEAYVNGVIPEPVTYRMFRYHVVRASQLEEDLAKNLRLKVRERGYTNAHRAMGPGEIYELDATGGRIILVSKGIRPVKLGTPWIYIVIDRWSRYVLAVYVTLRHPSYDGVSTVLLIAFTSRERFRFLGFEVDEERWPVGVPPFSILPDRGSEMTCKAFQEAVSGDDLRIGIINPEPRSPDAKAIIERLIRVFKQRMKASKLKGVFAERPVTPDARREKEAAAEAATESIWDLYRELLKIVDDHNNRPHKALKRNLLLKQAGLAATPRNAYVFGLEHITDLRKLERSTEDVRRILLKTETANLSNGVLRFRTRVYDPANDAAARICGQSTSSQAKVQVKVDPSAPYELFVPNKRGIWAHFKISQGGEAELSRVTLDEEEALAAPSKLLNAQAENDARIRRLNERNSEPRPSKRKPSIHVDRKEQNAAGAAESAEMNAALFGGRPSRGTAPPKKPPAPEKWEDLAAVERSRSVDATRRRLGLV